MLSACCTALEKSHDISVAPVSFPAVAFLPYSMGILTGTVPLILEDYAVVASTDHNNKTSQADSGEDCPHPEWLGGDETPQSTCCRYRCLASPRAVGIISCFKVPTREDVPNLVLFNSISVKKKKKKLLEKVVELSN